MNRSSFVVPKAELLQCLKEMARPFGRITSQKLFSNLTVELTITDNLLTLVIPGVKVELACKTDSTCKATIHFYYFLDVVKSTGRKEISCVVTENQIDISGLKVDISTTFFQNDSILRSIKLPVNYTDYHLLLLDKHGYTDEELLFNKIFAQIQYAKKSLRLNVNSTVNKLKVYGVRKSDIEELIMRKLHEDGPNF